MKCVFLFAVLIGSVFCVERDFSVRVKGQFLCHDKPSVSLPLDIYYQSNIMLYPDYMARFTDAEGKFDLAANIKVDEYMIDPYIVFRHDCWERPEMPGRCKRKIMWRIPGMNVTAKKVPEENRIFNIGTVDLRFKHEHEVRTICGIGKLSKKSPE
ncbi:unnamed protein product [Caenorhabditis sp. 36 PRJEB53466]|nr:unnamed protein product [Caenorhabditis sp. 36 PRJEB53466]